MRPKNARHSSTLDRVAHVLKLASFSLSLLTPVTAVAQTDVSGTINSASWDLKGSPYRVVGSLTVNGGLDIESGVEVILVDREINIFGSLDAEGVTFGGEGFPGGGQPWIEIFDGGVADLDNCELDGASRINVFDGGRLEMSDSEMTSGAIDTHGSSQAVCFDPTQITHPENRSNPQPGDPSHTLPSNGHAPAVCLRTSHGSSNGSPVLGDIAGSLDTTNDQAVASALAVRRLTPRECERLQGFPDDWTLVEHRGKPATDTPRYKALGNSMAIPVMRWIGERIERAERRCAS